MSLDLELKSTDSIELPDWISGSELSLAEIGAIVSFLCLIKNGEVTEVAQRMKSIEMTAAIASLKQKGILNAGIEGNKVIVDIDLEALIPESLKDTENTSDFNQDDE